MSIKTKPIDDERCDGCSRKLGNILAHHVRTPLGGYRFHPGCCIGETCTNEEKK